MKKLIRVVVLVLASIVTVVGCRSQNELAPPATADFRIVERTGLDDNLAAYTIRRDSVAPPQCFVVVTSASNVAMVPAACGVIP